MLLTPRTNSQPALRLKPGRWTVGSAATCGYRVVGAGVQPRHALLLCGGHTVVLKAWDSRTWCNEQLVQGEVALRAGDLLRLGTVEFRVEPASAESSPAVTVESPDQPTTTASDGDDTARLREQIQQLRDEMSQRLQQPTRPAAIEPPASHSEPSLATPAPSLEADALRVRAVESEQSLANAQRELETARRELAEVQSRVNQHQAELAAREAAWAIERHAARTAAAQEQELQAASAAHVEQCLVELRSELERAQAQAAAWQDERAWLIAETERLAEQLSLAESTNAQQAERQHAQQHQLVLLSEQWTAEQEVLDAQREQLQTQREALDRDLAEVWQTQAHQTREKQMLEHSWNWLQSERKQLAEEQTQSTQQRELWLAEHEQWESEHRQWQREREELSHSQAERQKRQDEWETHLAEKLRWETQRAQQESDCHTAAAELNAARADLQAEQQRLTEERQRLTEIEQGLLADREALERGRASLQQDQLTTEQDRQELVAAREALEQARREVESARETQSSVAMTALPDESRQAWDSGAAVHDGVSGLEQPFDDPWSAGVDLTDPYRDNVSTVAAEPVSARFLIPPADWSEADNPQASFQPTFTEPRAASAPQPFALETPPLGTVHSLASLCGHPSAHEVTEAAVPVASRLSDFVTVSASVTTETPAVSAVPVNNEEFQAAVEAETRALRERLADMFNMPDLRKVPAYDGEALPDPADLDTLRRAEERREPLASESSGATPASDDAPPLTGDESVEDSVSLYMRHLLTRSRGLTQPQHEPPPSTLDVLTSSPVTLVAEASPFVVPSDAVIAKTPPPIIPAHAQDKSALREATEKMRDVANQQARQNVEAHGWNKLRSSFRMKCGLALFSFMVSLGLFYFGYRYKPEFLVLGGCAACLGALTWIDLFLAVRETRQLAAQIGQRKKLAQNQRPQ